MQLDGGYTREAIGIDNPVTHKANSVCIRSAYLNRSTILLSRLSLGHVGIAGLSPKGVIGLTLFPPLPYHPPHVSSSNYLHDQHHGGRLGGVPR
jgi:hypothetical protein